MKVEIVVKTRKIKPNLKLVNNFIEFVSKKEIFKCYKNSKFTILFCGDRLMKKLNYEFRKKQRTTDVLSFPSGEKEYLGDIAISLEETYRNSTRFKRPFYEELLRLILHGILHLIGYEHEEGENSEMIKIQEKIINEYFSKNI